MTNKEKMKNRPQPWHDMHEGNLPMAKITKNTSCMDNEEEKNRKQPKVKEQKTKDTEQLELSEKN